MAVLAAATQRTSSLKSARWAGENAMNYLSSNVVKAEQAADFAEIQRSHIETYKARNPEGRVSHGLVVIPTDSATAEQRAKYQAYVDNRTPRTATPQGPARLLFARDLIGPSDQIAAELYAHPAFQQIDEVAFALPFTFDHPDYVQILTDIATKLAPALGWTG